MSRNAVFTLTSGRSGTTSLGALLKKNMPDCTAVHEPYTKPGNASMFGLPVYDHMAGNKDAIVKLVKKKSEAIKRYRSRTYIETSHAFLKSYWDVAPEFFKNMKVLHLVRHPLEVARSEANREAAINAWHMPIRYYRGRDGHKYFRWALTGREPIFESFNASEITRFQRYLIQWIEVENRAMQFLKRFDMDKHCMTLHTPHDLNNPQVPEKIFQFLDFEPANTEVILPGVQNRTPGIPTIVGQDELAQAREIIQKMPGEYLEIFSHKPYAEYDWVDLLKKQS